MSRNTTRSHRCRARSNRRVVRLPESAEDVPRACPHADAPTRPPASQLLRISAQSADALVPAPPSIGCRTLVIRHRRYPTRSTGGFTSSTILDRTSSGRTPENSASGSSSTRWPKTGSSSSRTSFGYHVFRPLDAAQTFAVRTAARQPRILTPRRTCGCTRVSSAILEIYERTPWSTCTSAARRDMSTTAWAVINGFTTVVRSRSEAPAMIFTEVS